MTLQKGEMTNRCKAIRLQVVPFFSQYIMCDMKENCQKKLQENPALQMAGNLNCPINNQQVEKMYK